MRALKLKAKVMSAFLALVGQEAVVCTGCDGTGETKARGDWCWRCMSGGIEVRQKQPR